MAYSNYGAFVYCDGERRRDKEDAYLEGHTNLPCHGILGDGEIVVTLYKTCCPRVWKKEENKYVEIASEYEDEYDDGKPVTINWPSEKGIYHVELSEFNEHAAARMITPDGHVWVGECGYAFGAGWDD